jgi:hypothetical protein
MLAEEKAMLVPSLDDFVRIDRADTGVTDARLTRGLAREMQLIARLRAGEVEAFEDLVNDYSALVYALAFRILNDRRSAG